MMKLDIARDVEFGTMFNKKGQLISRGVYLQGKRNTNFAGTVGDFLNDLAKETSSSSKPSRPARKVPVGMPFVTPTGSLARPSRLPDPTGLAAAPGRGHDQTAPAEGSSAGDAASEPMAARNPFLTGQWLPASAFKQPELPGEARLQIENMKAQKALSASAGGQPAKTGMIKALNLPVMKDNHGNDMPGIPDPGSVIRPLKLPPRSGPADSLKPLDLPGMQNLEYGNAEYGLPVPPEVVMTPASAAAAIAKGADPDADPDELNHHEFLFGAGKAPLLVGMPTPNSLHGAADSSSFLGMVPSRSNMQTPSGFLEILTNISWPRRNAALGIGAGLGNFVSNATLAEAAGHHLHQSIHMLDADAHTI